MNFMMKLSLCQDASKIKGAGPTELLNVRILLQMAILLGRVAAKRTIERRDAELETGVQSLLQLLCLWAVGLAPLHCR